VTQAEAQIMAMLVLDRDFEKQIRAERAERGIDKYDEVWDGVYVMSPLADDEHQELVCELVTLLHTVVARAGLGKVRPGVNVSDRETEWTSDFRVPDVAVFVSGTAAINRGTHWQGGPDFAVEITSERDRSREKLAFYAKVGVRELLLVDRDPWALEMYRLQKGQLILIGRSTPEQSNALLSEVVPLSFRLIAAEQRPRIEVKHQDGLADWLI
jgi:Uma2 family endonuclease